LTQGEELKLQTYKVPDHIFGVSEEETKRISNRMRDIGTSIDELNQDIQALALGILVKVSQSTDEVSTTLTSIFDKGVLHSQIELQRARDRKERGLPPGKSTDAIGDELTWEQVLSRFTSKRRLWIITKDSDYGTSYKGEIFPNQLLYNDLRTVSTDAEIFLFDNIADGIKHFANLTGVQAGELPTPEQIKQIKKEEESLPPISSLVGADDAVMRAHAEAQIRQRFEARIYGGGSSPWVHLSCATRPKQSRKPVAPLPLPPEAEP
jgi:hypothetical protein